MKVSDLIVEILVKNEVKHIFGYIGGFNADIIDSICKDKRIKIVLNYNEQASGFAANGYAFLKNSFSVAIASGAPSACNLIGGIADAFFDSLPCIFIIGSPNSRGSMHSNKIRQNLFEEINYIDIVKKITKYAVKILDKNSIKFEFEKSFYLANHGRKGPVVIDIPYDISRAEVDASKLIGYKIRYANYRKYNYIARIKKIFENSKRPLIILGGGMRSAKCRDELIKFLQNHKIPCVCSLMGLDVLPHDHECYIGFIGHYGNRYANLALYNADVLLVLGSRLDERQLGGFSTEFRSNTKIIRVDIDKCELRRRYKETISVNDYTENFLEKINKAKLRFCDYFKWRSVILKWIKRYPSIDYKDNQLLANNIISCLSKHFKSDSIICADVGQNQMSVAQTVFLRSRERFITSGGYGSMGFSLPASIGCAYVTNKNKTIISISGDGGLQMNIQELETIIRDSLPIFVVVLNNKCLGMIRKTQEKFFDSRFFVSVEGYAVPSFEKIARSYQFEYIKISSLNEVDKVVHFMSENKFGIIEVELPTLQKNLPEPGKTINNQVPYLSNEEINNLNKECMNV